MSVAPSRELSPLQSLIERLEVAPWPNGRNGYDLLTALLGRDDAHVWLYGGKYGDPAIVVDAAIALVERVLPGWGYDITFRAAWGNCTACVIANDRHAKPYSASGKTAALALCAALLRAVQAQETLGQRNDGASPQGSTDV